MRPLSEHSTDRAVAVEYEDDTDTHRGTFDDQEIAPSMAVVEVMAHVVDTDPLQLDPLHETIDPESIDRLCTRASHGRRDGDRSIEFTYHGFDVTVKSYGVIEAEPTTASEG